MRQDDTVSRRKAVTLVAGTLAASAGPVATSAAAYARAAVPAQSGESVTLLLESRRRVLELLHAVRRTSAGSMRAQAFRRLTTALHMNDVAEQYFRAALKPSKVALRSPLTSLYHHRDPKFVLARVIARELEAGPQNGAAWMTRFADLEAAIRAQTTA